jgi:hypothetical protein
VALAGLSVLPFMLLLILLGRWAGGLVDRLGPRRPLIGGPLLVGASYVLLALPGLTAGPAAYATTFLPGILVLGLGMAITIAPLTTAVMLSVDARQAGLASGINNAASRTAGVLGLAILGAAALLAFRQALAARTEALGLPAAARAELALQAARLGEAQPPATLSHEQQAEVSAAIRLALADTFRAVAVACALLAWLGALAAAVIIEQRPAAASP